MRRLPGNGGQTRVMVLVVLVQKVSILSLLSADLEEH